MDMKEMRLECLKMAQQECRERLSEPAKIIERADELFRFVIGGVEEAARDSA